MIDLKNTFREDFYWLNDESRLFLSRGYLKKGQSAEERIREIADTAEKILGIKGYSDKFYKYMSRGYYSLSSPIWSNFGNDKGLPISCTGSFIEDSMEDILFKSAEVGMMTKFGAGTSGYFGAVRARGSDISVGGKSSGSVHFMEMFDTITNVVSQSNIRRGSFASYQDAEHGDIEEFLEIREEGNPIQEMSIGVCISDNFIQKMKDGDMHKRKIWARILKKRFETGYPYIFFTDNVNRNKPQVYKDKNLRISHSNLCSEIALYNSEFESFICDLSSMNLLTYNEWRNTDAVEVLTYFLDAVMEEYIQKIKGNLFMRNAYNFAVNQRALGIGVLGWHSLLQENMIPFESIRAMQINDEIWKLISSRSYSASEEMAQIYGEPELLKGYGMRNVTTMAVAPTTSSSFILGQVSPSIEPLNSNYFVKDLAKGKFSYRNPHLIPVLEAYNKNTEEVWMNILKRGGSVQHLDFLSQEEKDVFKTFGEISQKTIIDQASQRQKYIDQSQSLNLMIHPTVTAKEVSQLLLYAHEMGIKTLYYQRSANPSQELSRSLMNCVSCES